MWFSPVPDQQDALDAISRFNVISVFDLRASYWQTDAVVIGTREYNLVFRYIKAADNEAADCLSRNSFQGQNRWLPLCR
jgi:hypothetical protein